MKKKALALALAAALCLTLLSACGGKKETTLKVGASPTPHAEILENAAPGPCSARPSVPVSSSPGSLCRGRAPTLPLPLAGASLCKTHS